MRVLILIFILTSSIISFGQRFPKEVEIKTSFKNKCGDVVLGSGFDKSGMVRYVARPKIIHATWIGNKLAIKTSVVTTCCPPDYLGYTVKSDTIILYYGFKNDLPVKEGQPRPMTVCFCGFNGCCYEFDYEIRGLDKRINYLITTSPVFEIGLSKPYPINYLNNADKSIYYQTCDNLKLCLSENIKSGLDSYKKLRPLYVQLLKEIEVDNKEKEETVQRIKKIWIEYFTLENAINDGFIKSKLDPKIYSELVTGFRLM